MDDSSDDDLEIGPQKSAEELLRERERLAEARGDVVDVGADDADMPPAPVAVKPEKVKPSQVAARSGARTRPSSVPLWLGTRKLHQPLAQH